MAVYLLWIACGVSLVGLFVLADEWLDIRKHEREARQADEARWSA